MLIQKLYLEKKNLCKLFVTIITSIMACSTLLAAPISVEDAAGNASTYLFSKVRRVKGTVPRLTLAHTINLPASQTKDAALFIFNIDDNGGFVIASADDNAKPVLGYSDKGGFTTDNLPPNFKELLDSYVEQIAWARSNNITFAKKAKAKAGNTNGRKDIWSLIATCWNQNYPFNLQCNFNGNQCVTGCVATAMAQLVNYWATIGKDGKKFRGGCTSLIGYLNNDFTVPPLEAVSSFDWDNMRNNYYYSFEGDSEPDDSEKAVAQLMRYCGQSAFMDYGVSNSGAWEEDAANALFSNFHYFCDMKYIKNEDMTNDEWDALIYHELENGRPVLMGGVGHAFLCDGYDSEWNQFHFNWGWSGSCDGFYAMDALLLGNEIVDDEVIIEWDFSHDKTAVININPLASNLEPLRYGILSDDGTKINLYYDNKYNARDGRLLGQWESKYMWSSEFPGHFEIKTLQIDKSLANYHPTEVKWLNYYIGDNTTDIIGLQYINTDRVTNMHGAFKEYFGSSLDLRSFDTSNVSDMSWMFGYCPNLQYLDISSFVFKENINSNCMFDCPDLRFISIPATANYLEDDAFLSVRGGGEGPCLIYAPEGFDFGVDTSGDYFKWKGGYFKLCKAEDLKPGDVNHDLSVSITDISKMASYILNNDTDFFYKENADLNGDGEISITDIYEVVGIILSNK